MAVLTFHAGSAGKIKRGTLKAMIAHNRRGSDLGYTSHSNKEIDTSKSQHNLFIANGSADDDIDVLINKRLGDRSPKQKRRKDEVLVREIITQPSADVFENIPDEFYAEIPDDVTDEEEREMLAKKALMVKFTHDAGEFFKVTFGDKNFIGGSVHMDETNPHVHMTMVPMTDDGRLSQKEFFKGPNHLKAMHKLYRKHMNDCGWNFEEENKYAPGVKGYTMDQYKNNADVIENIRSANKEMFDNLVEKEGSDRVREQLDELGRGQRELLDLVQSVEADAQRRDAVLVQREKDVGEREEALTTREGELERFDDELRVKERELSRGYTELYTAEGQLEDDRKDFELQKQSDLKAVEKERKEAERARKDAKLSEEGAKSYRDEAKRVNVTMLREHRNQGKALVLQDAIGLNVALFDKQGVYRNKKDPLLDGVVHWDCVDDEMIKGYLGYRDHATSERMWNDEAKRSMANSMKKSFFDNLREKHPDDFKTFSRRALEAKQKNATQPGQEITDDGPDF